MHSVASDTAFQMKRLRYGVSDKTSQILRLVCDALCGTPYLRCLICDVVTHGNLAVQILQRISAPRASVSSDFAKQNRSTRCGGGSR